MGDIGAVSREPTKEQIAEYKEAFSLFDKDGDGIIDIRDLGLLVRSLNKNPTEQELEEMASEVDPLGKGKVEFPDFLSMMASRQDDCDPEEELYEAFKVWEKEKPTMFVNVLKHLVMKGKEPFTEDEAEEMIKELGGESQTEFKIEDFIKLVLSNMNQN
ncbi:hypothetical protein ABPG74_006048 [Tetrahymena malaccensis]